MALPLAGIRVLDLTRILAGPYASMLLADMGAEVIKLEPPLGDEFRYFGPPFQKGESHLYMAVNRNKKGIVIDLKKDKGKEIIYKLVKRSDVFMQNFRPGVAEKLGLNYEKLKENNSRLIYCVNTAFGEKGPYKDQAGFDLILQGHGGTMYRPEGEPQLFPVLVADTTSGMLMAYGIMVALYERQKTGRGQMVVSSLFNSILAQQILTFFEGEETPPFHLIEILNKVPTYHPYRTKDKYINIAAITDNLFMRLCEVMGLNHLANDPKYDNFEKRLLSREELIPIFQKTFLQKPAEEWLKSMHEAGIPAGPVSNPHDLIHDAQTLANDMVVELDHPKAGKIKQMNVPIRLSETPGSVRTPAPTLNQHTKEVLSELGYTEQEITELQTQKVI